MPLDGKGNYNMNPQRGRAMSAMGDKPKNAGLASKEMGETDTDGDTKVHEIHEKADGSFHTKMADGKEEDHPDHLHAVAHIAHHISGGDKHHITHHDGMSMHSHGISESGEHTETEDHNTADDAKEALGRFFDEEAEEPQHDHEDEDGSKIGGGF